MAPVVEALGSIPEISVYVLAVAGMLVTVLLVLMCADGNDKKKTQKMTKIEGFSDIARPGGATASGTSNDQGGVAKFSLHAEIPLPSAQASDKPRYANVAVERLGIDSMEIIRRAFKDDKTLRHLDIEENRLELSDIIGSGNFGLVYKGTLLDKNLANPKEVAVKTVHGTECTRDDLEKFIKESVRMRGFAHENVMCVTGIVTRDNKPFIVLPYMHNGDLRSYVAVKTRKFTLEALAKYGHQVAQGMTYLSAKKFIHRDLAARNCMVSHDLTVKVSDFGLSRDLYASDYYKMSDLRTPLPIRWVALESVMTSKFTTKSDVWSFGVLFWELLTRGRNPYPDIRDNVEVLKFIRSGGRMECPAYVPAGMRVVMEQCWIEKPSDRPDFLAVSNMLHSALHSEGDYLKPRQTNRS